MINLTIPKDYSKNTKEALFWWMCDGAPPSGDGRKIISEICARLIRQGVQITRFSLFLSTIHPTITGRRLLWTKNNGVEIQDAGPSLLDDPQFVHSPMQTVHQTKQSLRRKLSDPDCPMDFPVLLEFVEQGFTDYLAQPLTYVDGETHIATWTTDAPDGFSIEATEILELIRLPLARITESYVLRMNASFLLSTYVGRNAGEQVLSGMIKRGEGEDINAVILFADMKDFTLLSNQMSNSQLLDILNTFFEALEDPIRSRGGEILKFVGDGLLAIFPVDGKKGARQTATNAAYESLQKAEDFLDNADLKNIKFRAALHTGEIHYGNIGGNQRLDFTAIGQAVNLTARMLSHAPQIACDHVCSPQIAQYLPDKTGAEEKFEAKGFPQMQKIHPLQL